MILFKKEIKHVKVTPIQLQQVTSTVLINMLIGGQQFRNDDLNFNQPHIKIKNLVMHLQDGSDQQYKIIQC